MTFRMFVGDQLGRLAQFRDFGTLPESGRKELIDWVAKASGFPNDDKRQLPGSEWIANFPAAQRVHALVNDLVEQPSIGDPGPAIKATWKRLYPTVESRIASPDCEFCRGTGWEDREFTVKDGVFAGEVRNGVTRCRCGGMPPTPKPDATFTPTEAQRLAKQSGLMKEPQSVAAREAGK